MLEGFGSPFKKDPPTAMIDQHGNIVTSAEGIKKETMNHYKKVLSNRPINPELTDLQNKKRRIM